MKNNIKHFLFILFVFSQIVCAQKKVQMITTTEAAPWRTNLKLKVVKASPKTDIAINRSNSLQTIEGFGTCFNELGWTSLKSLSDTDVELIMKELFEPGYGANFTLCRMPIGANDFAQKWYSYNERDGDFLMENFSISNDLETLVPFIKNALKYNSKLKLWASPWSPPAWMKYNKHYAAKSLLGNSDLQSKEWGMDFRGINNGLPLEREGKEGTNMFIQEDQYLNSYALYFSKFIKAYRDQNININMVMPQNEFNSAQVFPSCTWTASGLAKFIGEYLGPEMKKLNVDIMFGTMERPSEVLVDTILTDPVASKYIEGVGFQWAGKDAIGGIHKRYPDLRLYQTEQECGNGDNDWKACKYSWNLLKQYMKNGANAYMYWNTSLKEGGISTWGWRQNSLVSVDTKNHTYQFNHEYYLMKHISHFVLPGAKLLETTGAFNDLLAFENLDKSLVIIIQNEKPNERKVSLKLNDTFYEITLQADSFSTISVN
jgi:glucosylceramidase